MINDKCIIYHNIQWSLGAFVSNQCNGLRITWLGRWVLDFLRMDIPSKPRVTSKEMGCTSKSASISPLQQRLGNPGEGFLFSRSLWRPTCRVFVYLRLGSTVSLLGKVATVTLAENMLLLLIAGIFTFYLLQNMYTWNVLFWTTPSSIR